MSLDEEIALYQFAQGVRSAADLVEYDSPADVPEKTGRFLYMNGLVRQLKPTDADVQQALTDSSLTEADISGGFVRANGLKFVLYNIMNLSGNDYTKAYTFLLYLLKVVYQRRFTLGNPADWRYWDLSSAEVVQNLLTKHQEILEDVYADVGFRSEFAHMAKLWHERTTLRKAEPTEPAPEQQTHFHYLSYDEMITESVQMWPDKQTHGINLLHHSLEKALTKRYGFDKSEAQRVILEVIERHLRDTYHTDLF